MFKTLKKVNVNFVELILAISVMAIIVAGSFKLYMDASTSIKVNKTISDVTTLSENIKSLYKNANGFKGLNNQFIVTTKISPKGMHRGEDLLANIFGGNVIVETSIVRDIPSFLVTIDKIPQNACIKLANSEISSWGLAVKDMKRIESSPLSVRKSMDVCEDDLNKMIFIFNKY